MARRIVTAREQLKLFPGSSAQNIPYSLMGYAENLGDLSVRKVALPDPQNILASELGTSVPLAHRGASAFVSFPHIVRGGSKMKVRGLNADSSIARVQDVKIANIAVKNLVRGAVSKVSHLTHAKTAVPPDKSASLPVPAILVWRGFGGHVPEKGLGFGHSARAVRHA